MNNDFCIEEEYEECLQEIERLNNDIKILLKENENKEKVILKYDNIINELEKWLNEEINNDVDGIKSFSGYQCKRTLDKLNELKGDSSN